MRKHTDFHTRGANLRCLLPFEPLEPALDFSSPGICDPSTFLQLLLPTPRIIFSR